MLKYFLLLLKVSYITHIAIQLPADTGACGN